MRSLPSLCLALLILLLCSACDDAGEGAPRGQPADGGGANPADASPTDSALPGADGELHGRAWLDGPVADAPVALFALGAVGGPPLAVTRTRPDGRFSFSWLQLRPERHRIRVDLAGLPGRAGPYLPGQHLSTTVDPGQEAADLSPWTTLVDVAADALAASGAPAPVETARNAFGAHLGFDPQATPVGAPGEPTPAAGHRLLTETFPVLARKLSAGTGGLLFALSADLAGPTPARLDGLGPAGEVRTAAGTLDPEALRRPLAAALLDVLRSPAWRPAHDPDGPVAWQPLHSRLLCSNSALFGLCPPATQATINGFIHKGIGVGVEVQAYAYGLGAWPLGAGTSDAEGAVRLSIADYAGPVLLVAGAPAEKKRGPAKDAQKDDPEPGAGGPPGPGAWHLDELRGWMPWRPGSTLRALIADFDVEHAQDHRIVLTPLSDLALARTEHALSQGAALGPAYAESVASLNRLFELEPGQGFLLTRPARPGIPEESLTAARLGYLLGCFSAQAQTYAEHLAEPEAFDALDLVALLRADVRADGRLDGAAEGSPVRVPTLGGAVELPFEPLRQGLVLGCGRWNAHTGGPRERAFLNRLSNSEDPFWTNGAPPARPYPQATVELEVLAGDFVESTPWAEGEPTHPIFNGPARMRIRAEHPAGVALLEVPALADTVQEPAHPVGGARWTDLHLRPRANQERYLQLPIRFTDGLGREHHESVQFEVDTQAPRLRLSHAGRVVEGHTVATRAQAPLRFGVLLDDAQDVHLEVHLDDALVYTSTGERWFDLELDLTEATEGDYPLRLTATDTLGHVAERWITVIVDRTPPSLREDSVYCPDGSLLPLDWEPADFQRPHRLLRPWQTTLTGLEGAPPCRVTVSAFDDRAGSDLVPVASACLTGPDRACLPGTFRRGIALAEDERGRWRLPITAGLGPETLLAFDPLAPDAAAYAVRIDFDVYDAAGNHAALRLDPHTVEPIAPPVETTLPALADPAELPEGVSALSQLGWDGPLADYLTGQAPQALHLRRVRLRNPHPIPVEVEIERTGEAPLLQARVERRLVGAEVFEGVMHTAPECAFGLTPPRFEPARLVDGPACTLRREDGVLGLACSRCLAAAAPGPQHRLTTITAYGAAQAIEPEADDEADDEAEDEAEDEAGDGADAIERWRIRLEPGAEQIVDLASPDVLGFAGPVFATAPAHPSGARHVQQLVQPAFWWDAPLGQPGRWLQGPGVEALQSVTLTGTPDGGLRIGSVLNGNRGRAVEAGWGPPTLHRNPTLD